MSSEESQVAPSQHCFRKSCSPYAPSLQASWGPLLFFCPGSLALRCFKWDGEDPNLRDFIFYLSWSGGGYEGGCSCRAAGESGRHSRVQRQTRRQCLSRLEREDSELGEERQAFESAALCMPHGKKCGCLLDQAGQGLGPSPLLSGLAVSSLGHFSRKENLERRNREPQD